MGGGADDIRRRYGNNNVELVYTDGDGTEHYFFEQDGKIIDEDGLGYTLSDGTHGGKRITTKDKSFLDFDAAGRLVYIENADGNHITVNLKMLGGYWVIDYVEDGAGDRITFPTPTPICSPA